MKGGVMKKFMFVFLLVLAQVASAREFSLEISDLKLKDLGKLFELSTGSFEGNSVFFAPKNIALDRHEKTILMKIKKEQQEDKDFTGAQIILKKDNGEPETVLYGRFETTMKAGCGSSVVSAFFLYRTNPWQEIDFELIGGRPNIVQTSFVPDGDVYNVNNVDNYKPQWNEVSFNPCESFNTYMVDWTPEHLAFYVNGKLVDERRADKGDKIPNQPLKIYFNAWLNDGPDWAGLILPSLKSATMEIKDFNFTEYIQYH